MAAVLCAMLCTCFMPDNNIYITALNTCNEQSQGSEIWIEKVIIDGESYAPQQVFSGNWLDEGGYYKWRSYEQPEGLSNRLFIPFIKGQNVSVVFEANKYRGMVEIKMPFFSHTLDCYSDSNSSVTYDIKYNLADLRIPGKFLFFAILTLLFLTAALSNLVFFNMEIPKLVKSREVWLDLLKVICAFLIVELHTVGRIYTTYELGSLNWFAALILNTIPRCAVPIFIMITGILLLDKDMTMKKALQKVQKAVYWLITWNVLYIFLQQVLWGSPDGVFSSILSIPVKRGPSGHLWYAYLLVWIYAFAPIFNVMYKSLTNNRRLYFIAITLIVPGLLDMYLKCFNISSPEIVHSTILYMSFQYMGLMFLGRFIYDCFDKIQSVKYVFFATTIFGFGVSVILTWFFSLYQNQATDSFLMETGLPIIIYSAGLMGIFCAYKAKIATLPVFIKSLIVKLSQISLGIYFFHCVVMWTVGDISYLHLTCSGSIFSVLGCCVAYYLLSLLCVNLMSKMPWLEKFVKS